MKNTNRFADKSRTAFLFLVPFFLFFLIFQLFPLLYTLYFSFLSWDGFKAKRWIGFANYLRLLSDKMFYQAMANTIFIWFLNIVPRMGLALACASLLTSRRKYRGASFFRAVFYFPNLVTAASIATLFSFAFDWQTGTVNGLLLQFGIIAKPINWFSSPLLTQMLTGSIILWMWFGYACILFCSGMLSISSDLYEAAVVDGAGPWRQFYSITMPNLKGTFSYVFISSLIGGLQTFDVPVVLTDGMGSPSRSIMTVAMYMYNQAFTARQVGYGSAIAYGLFLVVMLLSILTYKAINGERLPAKKGVKS
jgi:multiple sugar transport system permease protein